MNVTVDESVTARSDDSHSWSLTDDFATVDRNCTSLGRAAGVVEDVLVTVRQQLLVWGNYNHASHPWEEETAIDRRCLALDRCSAETTRCYS